MTSQKLIALRIQLHYIRVHRIAIHDDSHSIPNKPLSTHSEFATYDSIRIDFSIHHDAFWLRTTSKSPAKSNAILSFWTVYLYSLPRGGNIHMYGLVDKWNHKLQFDRSAHANNKEAEADMRRLFWWDILLFCSKLISNWCDTRVSTSKWHYNNNNNKVSGSGLLKEKISIKFDFISFLHLLACAYCVTNRPTRELLFIWENRTSHSFSLASE